MLAWHKKMQPRVPHVLTCGCRDGSKVTGIHPWVWVPSKFPDQNVYSGCTAPTDKKYLRPQLSVQISISLSLNHHQACWWLNLFPTFQNFSGGSPLHQPVVPHLSIGECTDNALHLLWALARTHVCSSRRRCQPYSYNVTFPTAAFGGCEDNTLPIQQGITMHTCSSLTSCPGLGLQWTLDHTWHLWAIVQPSPWMQPCWWPQCLL